MKKINLLSIALIILMAFMFSTCGEEDYLIDKKINGKTITSNTIGTSGGYGYEFWKNNNASGSMTLGKGGTFKCEWTSNGSGSNILFRRGQKWPTTPYKHKQIGDIKVAYIAETYSPSNSGASYLCVYGWTKDPLIEYYIVDNWAHTYRGNGVANGRIATINVDGGTYDIYKSKQVNQPAIAGQGLYTFDVYWSVRQDKRTSGTISVSEHFKAWEKAGLPMGNLYEVALNIEGWQNTGSAKVIQNTLVIKK